MRVTPRIPITEPCLQLIAPACCTQIMLPTQADAPRLTAELRAYLGKHATADVAYLGFLQGHHGKFANHAMWTTPRGAEFLLHNTKQCIAGKGVSIDTFMWEACSSKRLRCSFPISHRGPSDAGGRHFVGFLHQDRKTVTSYLHKDNNKLRKGDPVPQLLHFGATHKAGPTTDGPRELTS